MMTTEISSSRYCSTVLRIKDRFGGMKLKIEAGCGSGRDAG